MVGIASQKQPDHSGDHYLRTRHPIWFPGFLVNFCYEVTYTGHVVLKNNWLHWKGNQKECSTSLAGMLKQPGCCLVPHSASTRQESPLVPSGKIRHMTPKLAR